MARNQIHSITAVLLIAGCTSTRGGGVATTGSVVRDEGRSVSTERETGPRAEPVASAEPARPQAPVAPAPEVGIEVSPVSARGLASIGATDPMAIAAWFNEANSDTDPFLAKMTAEIRGIDTTAAKFDAKRVSAPTVAALAAMGVTAPSGVATLDFKKLEDSKKAFDLCRNEIASAMQAEGWTVLRAEVRNAPKSSGLSINGAPIGSVPDGPNATWKRFLIDPPCDRTDGAVFATVSVDLPDPVTGLPAPRWFRDFEFVRGGEVRTAIDVASVPLPSIGFAAATALEPTVVYAGDAVTLTVEGGSAETQWFLFGGPETLRVANTPKAPSGVSMAAGLAGWQRLREASAAAASPRSALLEGAQVAPLRIGSGGSFVWRPEFETPSARIGVLTRGPSGYWGFAERSIAVADLRPGLWMIPSLPLDPASAEALMNGGGLSSVEPTGIHATHALLAEIVYAAKTGVEVAFDLRGDEFVEASMPLAGVTVDFGDGSAPVEIAADDALRAQVTHAFASDGDYRVSVTTRDAMGFARTHALNIRSSADAPAAPSSPLAVTRRTTGVGLRVAAQAAGSSFSLFDQLAKQFADAVAVRTAGAWKDASVALVHHHDAANADLVDMLDAAIVGSLLREGANVFERDADYQRGILLAEVGADPELDPRIPSQPGVDRLIQYKLKRAQVELRPAGPMMARTARILAFVRVHERATMRILFEGEIATTLGDTVVTAETGGEESGAWDSFPEGFLVQRKADGTALRSIEIETTGETETEVEAAPTEPVAPAAPSAPELPDVGGMFKGLFGG